MEKKDFIIEIGYFQKQKFGKSICGDTFLSKKVKGENRYVSVLSDGLGSGIRANVLSTLTASMALNFRLMHEPIVDAARWIMDTLPVDPERNISYSTFTIIDVDFEGGTTVIEYGNPSYFIELDNTIVHPERTEIKMSHLDTLKVLEVSSFNLSENDRLIVVTDGVTQSGMGNISMPFGWGAENIHNYVVELNIKHPGIAATNLAKTIVKQAEKNDIYKLKDDTSCAVIYRRRPRKLIICSGPPYNNTRDKEMASTVEFFEGKKIVCGGTTAKILARELSKEIVMDPLDGEDSDLPPASKIDGIDLVTEGILTLGKVSEILNLTGNREITEKDPANLLVKHLLDADTIEFMIGTCVNVAHQDPCLPIELDIRRNIIKRIAGILEDKFLKQVSIKYL